MNHRSNEKLKKLFEDRGAEWVREQIITDGGEINRTEKAYAEVWIENWKINEDRVYKKKEKRNEIIWNLTFLFIGALITTFSNYILTEIQIEKQKQAIIIVIKADVDEHMIYLRSTIDLFSGIKDGKYSKITQGGETLDIALRNSNLIFDIALMDHRSLIIPALIGELNFLPKNLLPKIIKFYRELAYCEDERIKAMNALKLIQNKDQQGPSKTLEGYLAVMKFTVDIGEVLLDELRITNPIQENKK